MRAIDFGLWGRVRSAAKIPTREVEQKRKLSREYKSVYRDTEDNHDTPLNICQSAGQHGP